jgi:hypothetical protein
MSLPIQKSAAKTVSLLIQRSATKHCAAADPEISSKTVPLPMQKSAANYVVVNLEIGSKELCCCQSRNQQQRTVPLPIQKSVVTVESCFGLAFFFVGCLQ